MARPTGHGPVIIHAPFRRDAAVLRDTLRSAGVSAAICADIPTLTEALKDDVGALVLTQEALSKPVFELLGGWLGAQEAWSEPPLLAFLDSNRHSLQQMAVLLERLSGSALMVLERPVRTVEFVSCVQSALRARRRQFELRDQLVLQADLLGELSHRVKNALANVFAVYRMTLRNSTTLAEFDAAFGSRLTALSDVHQLLVASGWQGADLRDIAMGTTKPYSLGDHDRITAKGPSVPLAPRTALAFALCLHELATNAAKYGALTTADGTLAIRWTAKVAKGGRRIDLEWVETGGPPVKTPTRKGFGTRFIEASVASETNGQAFFEFDPAGLRCRLTCIVDRAIITNM